MSEKGAKKLLKMVDKTNGGEGIKYPIDWEIWAHQYRKSKYGKVLIPDDPYNLHIYAHKSAVRPKGNGNAPLIMYELSSIAIWTTRTYF